MNGRDFCEAGEAGEKDERCSCISVGVGPKEGLTYEWLTPEEAKVFRETGVLLAVASVIVAPEWSWWGLFFLVAFAATLSVDLERRRA